MTNAELGRQIKEQYPQYANYSDEEIGAKMATKNPQYAQQQSSIPTMSSSQPEYEESFFERFTPTAGSIAGGMLAPVGVDKLSKGILGTSARSTAGSVGSAAGYSIGDSLREMFKQTQQGGGLQNAYADRYGRNKGAQLTDFGQQRAEETGLTSGSKATPEMIKQLMSKGQKVTDEPEFNIKLARAENVTDPENLKKAAEFAIGNLAKSTLVGVSDAAVSAVSNAILTKLLPKLNPKFGIKGLTTKQIGASSKELSEEMWKPIQETLESTTDDGVRIDVTPTIDKINKKMVDLIGTFDDGKMVEGSSAANKLAGYKNILEELTNYSTKEGNNYSLNPKSVQEITSTFGHQSASSIAGGTKTNIQLQAEDEIRKYIAPDMKKQLYKVLDDGGLKNSKKLYSDWANMKQFSWMIENRPVSGGLEASMAGAGTGTAASLAGVPGAGKVGAATSLAGFLGFTPVGQQVARGAVKAPSIIGPTVNKIATPSILDYLRGEK